MLYYIFKIAVSSVLIVAISELAKRSSFLGALLASIPLVSVLAMFWLYVESKDAMKVGGLATNIFWLVLPSLVLFLVLPMLLKKGLHFYLSIGISISLTIGCYWLIIFMLKQYGIKL